MNTVMIDGTVLAMTKPKRFKNGGIFSKIEIAVDDADENHVEVQLWNEMARWCHEHVSEGDHIAIVGEAKTAEWTDKNTGEDRYRLVINVCKVLPGRMLREALRDESMGSNIRDGF